ncbi:TolC family protein [Trinickia diaoshuihuensis]|uniref:TolC family protein n=1 Tax=Trinickia diaoshuihuensis TaxID=2292265 RepID=UPI000E24D8E1|nr:TolC family protein [Trinickia diaoshuihuensis]
MKGKRAGKAISIGILAFLPTLPALAFDPLLSEGTVAPTPAGGMLAQPSYCDFGQLGVPLTLPEAVGRTLCHSPKTREAWASVKAQAAAVGIARAAYLPTLSGNWQGVRDRSETNVSGLPQFSSKSTANVQSESTTLSWVLFDFGSRSAALSNANASLAAAKATQDATLQTAFDDVAKDYYAVQAAQGALQVASDIERMTHDSMIAAQARVDRGVAPITDALQAQTDHDEAVFNLAKARGDAQTTIGTLASEMGFDPSEPIEMPQAALTPPQGPQFSDAVETLIEQVKKTHPSVLAAQAQVEAARAKVAQTRAQGRPSVSLIAKYSRSNQPQTLGLGQPTFPATGRDSYVGVQVTIPLFEGFTRHYQVDQARAEEERQEDLLQDARQHVALDVWNSYYALQTSSENASNSAKLLAIAERSFEAAQHRYEAGVGNILELLHTQTALANAKQRQVQAMADWNYARLDLASKVGRLTIDELAGR